MTSFVTTAEKQKETDIIHHFRTEDRNHDQASDMYKTDTKRYKPRQQEMQDQVKGLGSSFISSQRYVDNATSVSKQSQLTSNEIINIKFYNQNTMGGPFPLKLQTLLKMAEGLGFQHIISWLPHGRAFIIRCPSSFDTEIMPKFFNQTKFSSFMRQLNLYDFKRIKYGVDSGSYYHAEFLRAQPLLAMKMVRRKIKGKIRISLSGNNKPQFYSLPFMPPIVYVPRNSKHLDRKILQEDRRIKWLNHEQDPFLERSQSNRMFTGVGQFNKNDPFTPSSNIQTEINVVSRHHGHILDQNLYQPCNAQSLPQKLYHHKSLPQTTNWKSSLYDIKLHMYPMSSELDLCHTAVPKPSCSFQRSTMENFVSSDYVACERTSSKNVHSATSNLTSSMYLATSKEKGVQIRT